MDISMFCSVGQHGGPTCKMHGNRAVPAKGWREVKANYDPIRNVWVYNPSSLATIYCCPQHFVEGEPIN